MYKINHDEGMIPVPIYSNDQFMMHMNISILLQNLWIE